MRQLLPIVLLSSPLSATQGTNVCDSSVITEGSGGLQALIGDDVNFGSGVAGLGDLDGDGHVDMAVGVPGYTNAGMTTGAVWICFLDADGAVLREQQVSTGIGGFGGVLSAGDGFGQDLANLGDVNGDGIVDLAVGARGIDGVEQSEGGVWILFLDTDGTVKDERLIAGGIGGFPAGVLASRDFLGSSVAGPGDLDGNGVPDLVAGAPQQIGTSLGAAWVIFLDQNGMAIATQEISKDAGGFVGSFLDFGKSLAPLGDLDGDGFHDLVVGAASRVFVLFLGPDGMVLNQLRIQPGFGGFVGPPLSTQFGAGIGSVGDVNGDGIQDIAIGASQHDVLGVADGSLWICFLNADATVQGELEISGNTSSLLGDLVDWDQFGSGVAALGDPDGNGVPDLVVAADAGQTSRPQPGKVYVLQLGDGDPLAAFTASTTTGAPPLEVSFSDQSLGQPVARWFWDFGDGTTSTEENPTHTYTEEGVFKVELRVNDLAFGCSSFASEVITVRKPLSIGLAAGPTFGVAPLEVAFEDRSEGLPVAWSWDFGDGSFSTESDPKHVYQNPGTYSVTLSVAVPGSSQSTTLRDLVHVTDGSASATSFNGAGTNPDVLSSLSLPRLGSVWGARMDGSGLGAMGTTLLVGYGKTLNPSVGGSLGELLVDPGSRLYFGLARNVGPAGVTDFAIRLPKSPSLTGLPIYCQAFVETSAGSTLTNRLDLSLAGLTAIAQEAEEEP